MSKIVKQIEVSEKAAAMGDGLKNLVVAVKTQLADGWQPGQDLPVLTLAAVQNLIPVIQGAMAAGDEIKEDQGAFVAALALTAKDIADVFLKKA